MKKSLTKIIIISIILATTLFHVARAQTDTPILKIFYFRDSDNARISLFQHPDSIDVLAPQAYSLDSSGLLTGTIDPVVYNFTQQHNIKLMPLVTNKSFSKSTGNAILDDQSKQALAISALVNEAQKQHYWGWQVDFEGMDATYRDKFSVFIARMNAEFKTRGLVLSVAVIAQVSANPQDYPKDLWNRVIGVYDYAELALNTDFISVMSYDDPESTGPVSPYPWLVRVIDFSLKSIPANKLSLGVPLYYWQWNDTKGKLVDIGGQVGLAKTLKKRKVTHGYSKENQTAFIKFTIKKNKYSLWYEDEKSIAKKMELIKQYQLLGFSAWALGLETPSVHNVFSLN